jgi:prepilin-type N-terminal cleavage/methylation domain-containing protein
MNKKGFTLIELLSVIIILVIILLIAIPAVSKVIDDSKAKSYARTVEAINRAAELYVAKKSENIPGLNNAGDVVQLPLQTLIDEKLLSDKLYDNVNKTNINSNSFVLLSIDSTDKYNYKFININSVSDYVSDSSLKVWLDGYDAPSSNIWKDKSGNNNNGAIIGATYDSTNKGYNFNGNSSTVIATPFGNGINPNGYTISLVAKTNNAATSQMFLSTPTAGTNQRLYIGCYSSTYDTGIQAAAWGTAGVIGTKPASTTLVKSIVVVFSNGLAKYYLNNQFYFSRIYTSYTLAGNLTMAYFTNAYYLNGTIYSLRVYNRVLTSMELSTNYAIDKQRFNIQ